MLLPLIAAALTVPQAPASTPAPARCTPALVPAGTDGHGARFSLMGALPPAAELLGVWRRVDGCVAPIVLRRGLSAAAPPGR